MARSFFGLYLLVVLTLAAVSWGQDKLLQAYGVRDSADDRALAAALSAVEYQLDSAPPSERGRLVDAISAKSGGAAAGGRFELFAAADIAGPGTLAQLARGRIATLHSAAGDTWALKQVDPDHVLAFTTTEPAARRGPLEWLITESFYAVMALVIMAWIWPLTRDLRILENAAARFGNRNWVFDASIKPGSQIHALAETFRRMAQRIDGLITSHKDMSNAVSHEIKTPLSRMQFEIESAQHAQSIAQVRDCLDHIKSDIAAIDDLVSATLKYAILERADFALDLGTHDFGTLLPALTQAMRGDVPPELDISVHLDGAATHVTCDLHLIESAVKNLLYNAARYAKREVRLSFTAANGLNRLMVDDDGPGIPEKDRQRVFDSFVRLDADRTAAKGFGLGLAIVKRAIEWHGGNVSIATSPLGGARICAVWPMTPPGR